MLNYKLFRNIFFPTKWERIQTRPLTCYANKGYFGGNLQDVFQILVVILWLTWQTWGAEDWFEELGTIKNTKRIQNCLEFRIVEFKVYSRSRQTPCLQFGEVCVLKRVSIDLRKWFSALGQRFQLSNQALQQPQVPGQLHSPLWFLRQISSALCISIGHYLWILCFQGPCPPVSFLFIYPFILAFIYLTLNRWYNIMDTISYFGTIFPGFKFCFQNL